MFLNWFSAPTSDYSIPNHIEDEATRVENAKQFGLAVFKKSFFQLITAPDGNKTSGKFGVMVENEHEEKKKKAREQEIADAVARARAEASQAAPRSFIERMLG